MPTFEQYVRRVATIRQLSGLDPDAASDRIWAERLMADPGRLDEAEARIEAKARDQGRVPENILGQPTYRDSYHGSGAGPGGATEPALSPQEEARQRRAELRGAMRATLNWLPDELLNRYIDSWVDHGDPTLAWGQVRTSPAYERHFPGIKRDDGTLRMDEQQYLAHREAFRREFTQWGLNAQLYERHHVDLIQGDVSPQEFRQRLEAKITGVMQNLPEVRRQFGEFYGINAMDDRALIGAALDPDVGLQLLEGRITAAQIAGEAAIQGFNRSRQRSERLAQVGGLDQTRARQLFSQAAGAVPRFSRFSERFNDPSGFGIEQFEEASVFGDQHTAARMRRLEASEQALFRRGGQVAEDTPGILSGLQRR